MEGDQAPGLRHTVRGALSSRMGPVVFRQILLTANLVLDPRHIHAITPSLCGQTCPDQTCHVEQGCESSLPRGKKGHPVLGLFSCMFKCILSNLVQSDCGMNFT